MTELNLKSDNKVSFNLTKNHKSKYQTKHIDVQHHYVREFVNDKKLEIE